MFQDLDTVLKKILSDPAAPVELRNADVRTETPDRNFTLLVQQATLNLFLYEVKEDRELRDPVPIIEKVGNLYVRRLPPLRVDCCYIVTAWSEQTAEVRVQREHRLLSLALAWLGHFPVIPEQYLQGTSLLDQPFPLAVTIAQMHDTKDIGQFWTALGVPPRAAFYLTTTLAMDISTPVTGPLVTTRTTTTEAAGDQGLDAWVQIGGRVLDPGGQGIADALVDILDAGLRTKSDADGRYAFLRVPGGTHSIRVVATGFQVETRNDFVVPGLPGDYDLTLTRL